MITANVRASNVFGESNSTVISVTCVRLTNTNQVFTVTWSDTVRHCIVRMCDPDYSEERYKIHNVSTYHSLSFIGYSMLMLLFVIVGCVLLVISLILWLAVAFQVGLQKSKIVMCRYSVLNFNSYTDSQLRCMIIITFSFFPCLVIFVPWHFISPAVWCNFIGQANT